MNKFVGVWVGPDEYTSEVEYSVREENGKIVVAAQDRYDGEIAEVSNIQYLPQQLSFTAVWSSTGRIAQCVFELESENEIKLTFTFTDHARLFRKIA
ncbi:MAG: hypothetical protein Q4G39_05690 [Brachymonas sp.]|nr:hypothetical protein [Brachymonas sp.]